MVRRPAPVLDEPPRRARRGSGQRSAILALAAALVACAYFFLAPYLPTLPAGDVTVLVAGGVGLIMIAASTLALLPAYDTLIGPLLIVAGCGLIVGACNSDGTQGVGAAVNVFEALLAGAVGLLFARWLATPIVAIAVPLFVGAIDVWSVASGPTSRMLASGTDRVDPLSFDLPVWGGGASAGHLGVSDALFLSMFAAWAWRYGFRRTATLVGLTLGLIGSLVLSITLDEPIPALPLIAAGYLLPNIDRIGRLLAREREREPEPEPPAAG